MLIERIIGNLDDRDSADLACAQVDWLDLTWRDCAKRTVRKCTRGGQDVRILLPLGTHLKHHDVLQTPGGSIRVAVNLRPADVLVAVPRGLAEMGRLALELGNLHVPVEVREVEMVVLADGPTEALLARLGAPHRRETRRFTPEPCSITSLPVDSQRLNISRT
jgi:urease accessory protein UreE